MQRYWQIGYVREDGSMYATPRVVASPTANEAIEADLVARGRPLPEGVIAGARPVSVLDVTEYPLGRHQVDREYELYLDDQGYHPFPPIVGYTEEPLLLEVTRVADFPLGAFLPVDPTQLNRLWRWCGQTWLGDEWVREG